MSICNCLAAKLSVRHNIRNNLIKMTLGMKVSLLVVSTGEFILGMLGNGFIGLVNLMEWVKNGKVSSADFILTGLALARIIQLWVTVLESYIMGLFPQLYATGKLAEVVTILWILSNHVTLWSATCLSIFYFLKIASFPYFLFSWLKWRVNRVVLVLFLGSFFMLPIYLLMHDAITELVMDTYRGHEKNMTLHSDVNKIFYLKSLLFLSFSYVIPFLLSLISLLLLFLSLVRHTKNLQLNGTVSEDSSTEAHRRAMKMVTTFLLLFTIYIISALTATWIFTKVQTYQPMMFVLMISTIFPSGHSFIIILGNRKLRQIALRLLRPPKFS